MAQSSRPNDTNGIKCGDVPRTLLLIRPPHDAADDWDDVEAAEMSPCWPDTDHEDAEQCHDCPPVWPNTDDEHEFDNFLCSPLGQSTQTNTEFRIAPLLMLADVAQKCIQVSRKKRKHKRSFNSVIAPAEKPPTEADVTYLMEAVKSLQDDGFGALDEAGDWLCVDKIVQRRLQEKGVDASLEKIENISEIAGPNKLRIVKSQHRAGSSFSLVADACDFVPPKILPKTIVEDIKTNLGSCLKWDVDDAKENKLTSNYEFAKFLYSRRTQIGLKNFRLGDMHPLVATLFKVEAIGRRKIAPQQFIVPYHLSDEFESFQRVTPCKEKDWEELRAILTEEFHAEKDEGNTRRKKKEEQKNASCNILLQTLPQRLQDKQHYCLTKEKFGYSSIEALLCDRRLADIVRTHKDGTKSSMSPNAKASLTNGECKGNDPEEESTSYGSSDTDDSEQLAFKQNDLKPVLNYTVVNTFIHVNIHGCRDKLPRSKSVRAL